MALLVFGVGVFGRYFYKQSIKKESKKTVQGPTVSASPSPVPTSKPVVSKGIASDKIFYSKDNNIFSYDIKSKNIERWTNYPKNKDYSRLTTNPVNRFPISALKGSKL